MLGLANSNYAGLQALKLNPGVLSDSRLKYDINLVSFDIFGRNNYVFIPSGAVSLFRAIDGSQKEVPPPKDKFTEPPKDFYFSSGLMLPSVLISLRKHTFGFHIAGRGYVNADNVPFHIAKFMYDGIDFKPLHDIEFSDGKYSVAAQGWLEYGFTYSGVLYNKRRNYFSGGLNLNFNKGLMAAYYLNTDLQYTVPNDDTILVRKMKGELGYALPDGSKKIWAGTGTGFDLGFCYERKQSYRNSSVFKRSLIETYDVKVGASLLDVGKINYSGNVTNVVKMETDSAIVPVSHIRSLDSPQDLESVVNRDFYHNTNPPGHSGWSMSLPTAASFQFDYNMDNYYYVNGTIILNLTSPGKNVNRARELAVSLRYETKWLGFGIPLTFYNIEKPMLGFNIRIHSFFIGSDNFLPALGIGKIYGSSVFFGIKISGFKERWAYRDRSMYLPSIKGIFRPFWKKKL